VASDHDCAETMMLLIIAIKVPDFLYRYLHKPHLSSYQADDGVLEQEDDLMQEAELFLCRILLRH